MFKMKWESFNTNDLCMGKTCSFLAFSSVMNTYADIC